ncbi:MAG: OmpA family protein [Desulfuromusa sp.]|nr:OmpA family protein [Desulfuromusa sp.]
MKKLLPVLFFLFSIALVGCSTTRIVLLDTDKAANAIIVTTPKGELVLDEPNTFTELSPITTKPAAAKVMDQRELQEKYGQLISSAPLAPVHFLLYFEADSTMLMAQSKKLFPTVEIAIKNRIPCDVNIIGHTDSTGPKKYNIELSLRRARWVYEWLLDRKLAVKNIVVESYGEDDPLIPTPDGFIEPRNRRVEILIR